jgi:hypothetical protein
MVEKLKLTTIVIWSSNSPELVYFPHSLRMLDESIFLLTSPPPFWG